MSSRHGKLWKQHGRIANPRVPQRPQTPKEQDKEREALSKTAAPFPVRDPQMPHHPLDCPDPLGIHCGDASKSVVRRVVGSSPDPDELLDLGVSAGEPVLLVEQSQEQADGYLREPPE